MTDKGKSRKLKKKLAKLVNNEEHFSENQIEEKILKKHPVPRNVAPVKELDDYIKGTINHACENNRDDGIQALRFELARDKQLAHIEKKTRDVFGPLSSLLKLTVKAEKEKNQ